MAAGGSSQTLDPTQGSGGQSGSDALEADPECQLQEQANGPRLTLQGSVCGENKTFSTTAGQLIRLSRSSLFNPSEEITTFTLRDDPSDFAAHLPEYFDSFGFLFNVALEQGPALEVQSGDYPVETGLLVACGWGSLAFGTGMAQVVIESVEGDPTGQIRLKLSNLPVAGFDSAFGKTNVPACTGTVDVTLEGQFEHDPG